MPLSSTSSVSRTGTSSFDSDDEHNAGSKQGYRIGIRGELDFDDDNRRARSLKHRKRTQQAKLAVRRRLQYLDSTTWRGRLNILVLCSVFVIVFVEVRHFSQDRPSSTIIDIDAKEEDTLAVNEKSTLQLQEDDEPIKLKPSNLDKMDMPTKKIKGKEEPCLKLLPVEDLETTKLPEASEGLVRVLNYVHKRGDPKEREIEDSPMASAFAGYQTMYERAKSFELRDTMEVHCGFCEEGSGFDVDSTDKSFMEQCVVVVLTCTFGGGDDLYQPIGMTNASVEQVCYVALWDEVTLEAQAKEGKAPDPETFKVGLWRIVIVRNLPFSDQRRNGKIPKMLNHRLFPNARFSIWVDSKSQFRRDPIGVLEALLWRPKVSFAISEHGGRSCVYAEGAAIVRKHKALPEEVSIQLEQYRTENIPERALFHGHKALAEASVIVREHTTLTNLFMCLWFNEVMRFTARDQLSYPYVLLRVQAMQVNMFPVCTRRALVNSIGHKSKPKPLVIN